MKEQQEIPSVGKHLLFIDKIPNTMKLTWLFLSASVFGFTAQASAQRMSVALDNAKVEHVLEEITEQTGLGVAYSDQIVDLNRRVSIHLSDAEVNVVLDKLTEGTTLGYDIRNGKVYLYAKSNKHNPGTQQSNTVTGVVVDANGEPIIGANVVVKGTTNGTITDIDGRFSLEAPGNAVLSISYIGYNAQDVKIGNRSSIKIALKEDTQKLDEVIVVGYGTQKKSDLTGAVSSVKTAELQQTPMTSIDQGLVGRASGVLVTQTSGMPGAVASIRVRGSSSLQGGNEPLYVIDGFPVYGGGSFDETGGKTQMSGLSTVNPADIESIEILKDAAATAIYGARAANGVVLITTKSGKKGRDIVTFEASIGVSNVAKKIEVMGAQDYAKLVNEAYTNDGLKPYYDKTDLASIATLGNGTDWQDELFRTGISQNYQLGFSGGDEKTQYSISGNYTDQKGIIINSDFKRYSARVNLDRKISDRINIGTHLTSSYSVNNAVPTNTGGESGGVVNGALKMNPIMSVYEDVNLGKYSLVNTPGLIVPNPIATAKERKFRNTTYRLLGDMYFQWEIFKNLKIKSSFGIDVVYHKSDIYTPSFIYESGGIASASSKVNKSINWLNENIVTWTKNINDVHNLDVLAGFTMQQNNSEYVSASSQGFVNDVLLYNNLGSASIYGKPGSNAIQWNLMSYLTRLNYSLYDKYLFSVNARLDGSSRFGSSNKYGFFPSASAAWRISEESFFDSIRDVFSNLKLRTSFGYTGNTEIGVYESLATMASNNWVIGDQLVTGFYPGRIPNPELKWERTSQFDVGLDVGLFNNRLRITTDYYYKKTTDLLYDVAIPGTSGYQTMLKNIGSVQNQGYELSIDSDNLSGEFSWTTSFNISFNRNKVLELGGEDYKEVNNPDLNLGSFRRLMVGEPIGVFYGYRFDGIFQNEQECSLQKKSVSPIDVGLRRYVDINGDGVVDANNDREVIGDSNPDFFGGLTNTFSYKGFELVAFLQYCYGNDIFNFNSIHLALPSGGGNVYKSLLDRWTPDKPSNIYPKATTNRTVVVSDLFIEDGSYLKLKSLSFSYNFPTINFKYIRGIKAYVTAYNLLTFTKYSGFDPEVSYKGASTLEAGEDFGGYPQSRSFMFGVKIDLK